MFEFLKKYLINPKEDNQENKHSLYKVSSISISKTKDKIDIPFELEKFYEEIGYGSFHNNQSSFNKLFSPLQMAQINLREDFYKFDPDLELYEEKEYNDKLIFFEINEGVYMLIKKDEEGNKNSIWYFDEKVADSLQDFLIKFDKNPTYFEEEDLDSIY